MTLTTDPPLTYKRSLAANSTVGVGVVGCGYWGPNLVRNFFETPGCHVESICDALPERIAAMERRYPSVRTTTSFNDLLADPAVEAIVVATPVHTHGPLVKRALEAGKHVLVEKPMTLSVAEAEELVELAHKLERTLMVDHTFVYTGAVRRIKDLLDTGELGRLYYYDSVRVNLGMIQHDVSVVRDLAAHDFAIMDYLLPQRPIGVSATGAAHLPGGLTDVAYLTVQFEDDLLAHFHVNWLSPVKIRQVLVGGDRRMVVYDDIQPTEKVKVYDRGITWTDDPTEARREALVAYRSGDVHIPKLDQTEALRNECAHFIECVRTGATPITDGAAGLRTVRLLDASERSLANAGAMVRVSAT